MDHFTSKTVVGNCLVFILPHLNPPFYSAPKSWSRHTILQWNGALSTTEPLNHYFIPTIGMREVMFLGIKYVP